MKRRFGIIGTAVVCALLGLQAGTGSASAVVGGEAAVVAAGAETSGGPAGFPYVGSAAAQPDDGTRAATVRAAVKSPRHDYNGDGRSDMVAWYDYDDGHDGMRAFLAGADGSFPAPNRAARHTAGERRSRATGRRAPPGGLPAPLPAAPSCAPPVISVSTR